MEIEDDINTSIGHIDGRSGINTRSKHAKKVNSFEIK